MVWSPVKGALCFLSEMDTWRQQRWWPTGKHLDELCAHTHTQSHTLQSSKRYTDLCSSIARQAWLPNENKGCMYSADTHHQSQIACGHNDYLLYVNPLSNKAGYPLMRHRCYYRGQEITSKCQWPTGSDWLPPIETTVDGEIGKWWYQEPRLHKSSGSANDVCVFCPHLSEWAKVWHCQVNNESSLGRQHITAN